MSDPSTKIANYIVIRLLEAPPRPGATPSDLATSLLLDTVTVFSHASLAEYQQGIALAKALVGWKADAGFDRRLTILAEAIRGVVKP